MDLCARYTIQYVKKQNGSQDLYSIYLPTKPIIHSGEWH